MRLDHPLTIRDVALWRYRLPFVTPPPRMAESMTMREGFLLALLDDQARVHYGEIAPLPTVHAESMTEAAELLRKLLTQLKGAKLDLAHFDPYSAGLGLLPLAASSVALPSVLFGLEQALMSLICCYGESSLYQKQAALVKSWRGPSFTLYSAALLKWDHPLPATLKEDSVVKIKIGLFPAEAECAKLVALLRQLPARTRLRLDGNGSFTPAALLDFWQLCQRHAISPRIDYFEEPLSEPDAYDRLPPAIPIALDESLWERAPTILPYCQHYILKPTRLYGISGTMRWLRTIKAHDAKAIISGCYESGITQFTYARLIHGSELAQSCMGLGSYAYLAADLITPSLSLMPGRNLIQTPAHDIQIERSHLSETLCGWETSDAP